MTNDPVSDEVRRVRKLISHEIGANLAGMVEHYSKYDSRFTAKAIEATDRHIERCTEVAEDPLPEGSKSPATR